ncbi:DUF4062 domain-containing protein [Variovorax sp. J22R115]|uniref:DUF4062 domain-containing protein n=1 Tax=Variovorax sp. J22R115 TaxID=3053509 RepID=UPI0025757E00|nr:DUF4062 domain-containing protein [Variovorax sp. J22R115]MDM0054009.1 DUF4062 domain-containing protein [Variovorax sp. J22R115]
MRHGRTLYVSSTFEDLKTHRAAVKASLEKAGFDVDSMEQYAAFPEPPLGRCLADVLACDGYVLLLAHRYGFELAVDGQASKSITELEYGQAIEAGKPTFVFCVDTEHDWKPKFIDHGAAADKLAAFRRHVENAHGRALFTDPDNLARQVQEALASYAWPTNDATTVPPIPAIAGYRWPAVWDFAPYMAHKRGVFEGRDWLFREINAWLTEPRPRALLIHADFGVGKSAILSELVHRNPGGAIAAWHFCQHDTQETLHPGAFVRSLAAQFAASIPGYRDLIEADTALQERLDRALTDPGSAFEGSILAPLSRLTEPDTPRLLVIDALDEALELDTTTVPGSCTTLVKLLADKAGRFPSWLRVLATSRPNPQVLAPLSAFAAKRIDAESAGNQEDLRCYILGRCAREPLAGVLRDDGHAVGPLADLLVERSLGKFLYAVRAMSDVENGRIGVGELVALPPGMDSFYLDAFERRFTRSGRDYEGARRVLGVLALAREPVPPALLAEILQIPESEIKSVHKALPDFLRQRLGKLSFDHFSMAEWLTREDDQGFSRAGDYAVDTLASREAWRKWALRQVDEGVAHRSRYLLRHLPSHLGSDEERHRICGGLMFESFEWLQARLDLAGVEALLSDAELLKGVSGQPLLLAVLRNSAHVLRQFPDHLATQLLGRLGDGLGPERALASLTASAGRWLAHAEHQARAGALLIPVNRSLRLSTAHQATLVGGGQALAVLPDGRIASGAKDCTIRLWDPACPDTPLTFEGHSEPVTALAALPNGRIASAAGDGTVRLWDPGHSEALLVFEGNPCQVTALAVLPDGRIACGAETNSVRLWDPAHPDMPIVFEGHWGEAALAVLPDGRIASSARDGTVRLWDPAHPEASIVFGGNSRGVTALAVFPDGRIASGDCDGTVRLWDPTHPEASIVFEGISRGVTALVVLPDGRIASGDYDAAVRLWDPAHPEAPIVLEGHSLWVSALAVLPDGRIASCAGDETVRLWDPLRPDAPIALERHLDSVTALAVLTDGRIASGAFNGPMRLWDPAHLEAPIVFGGHSDWVRALAALPNGRIASGASDSTVRLWDAAHPDSPIVFEGHSSGVRALAVLADGRIASGGDDHTVRLWDPAYPDAPIVFDGHSFCVTALAILPDGRIASGTLEYGSTVRLWDPARPDMPILFQGHLGGVNALAVLPDGRFASCGNDSAVRLWDAAHPDAPIVFEGHSGRVRALAVLADGRIASGGDDHTVRLWDPAHPEASIVFEGHWGGVSALAMLPDGRIVSGANDWTVRLWDPTDRQSNRVFVADAAINCLAATPGGLIVAGCADGTVHFLREGS